MSTKKQDYNHYSVTSRDATLVGNVETRVGAASAKTRSLRVLWPVGQCCKM